MIQQLTAYRFTCDECGVTARVEDTNAPPLPEGWQKFRIPRFEENWCSYDRAFVREWVEETLHVCPACVPVADKKAATARKARERAEKRKARRA